MPALPDEVATATSTAEVSALLPLVSRVLREAQVQARVLQAEPQQAGEQQVQRAPRRQEQLEQGRQQEQLEQLAEALRHRRGPNSHR